MDIVSELEARGLIQDSTGAESLRKRLQEGPITLYYGCDPSANSLHVGNLIGLVVLRRFQLAGHRPIALAGGATGMIGDPSGKSDERNLLDDDTLASNVASIGEQMARILDFDDVTAPATLVDNRSWTASLSVLEFLRDPGKHVTVQQMMGKESVRARLGSEVGLSYTEFSYMLLQANDFAHLAEHENCELQIGGADQWGNLALGVDLTRRRLGKRVHALTWPLLTRADGSKYGKTAGGDTMWLNPDRMSPYRFFQGWMQVDDADVARLLLQLTFLTVDEAHAVAAEHAADPSRRVGQRRLAEEVTALVHGASAARAAALASEVLFGTGVDELDEAVLSVILDEVPVAEFGAMEWNEGIPLVDALLRSGLCRSRGEARRLVDQDGVSVNGRRPGGEILLGVEDLVADRAVLLRRGKRSYAAVTRVT